MKRSLRRHHKERLIRKMRSQDYYGLSTGLGERIGDRTFTEDDRLRNYKLSLNHRQSCSCMQCGNPRKQKFSNKDRITIQERRSNAQLKSFLDDM